jgi:hypothetical protein
MPDRSYNRDEATNEATGITFTTNLNHLTTQGRVNLTRRIVAHTSGKRRLLLKSCEASTTANNNTVTPIRAVTAAAVGAVDDDDYENDDDSNRNINSSRSNRGNVRA